MENQGTDEICDVLLILSDIDGPERSAVYGWGDFCEVIGTIWDNAIVDTTEDPPKLWLSREERTIMCSRYRYIRQKLREEKSAFI